MYSVPHLKNGIFSINHMDNAVTDFFNKMSDVLERQLGDDEVYAAVIAPEIELTITPLANVRSYLPCFDETDSCYSISEDVPLALCYDPRQVITLAGKRYLSGAVIFVRYDTDGNFVALTTSDLYLIQCYLGENSVPLMAGREKMVCICIPEMAKLLGIPREKVYWILDCKKYRDCFVIERVADRRRITKTSFEIWLNSQSTYRLQEPVMEAHEEPPLELKCPKSEKYYSFQEIQDFYGVSRTTLVTWIREEGIPTIDVGRAKRVRKDVFDDVLKSKRKVEGDT